MTAVRFYNYRGSNFEPPLTLEEVFRLYGAYSNLHEFSFDNLETVSSLEVEDTSSGGYSSGGGYAVALTSFEVKYHKTQHNQGVIIISSEGLGTIEVSTNSSGNPIVRRNNTIVQSVPITSPEEADVRLVFRQQQNLDNEEWIWTSVALYMNDALITTYMVALNRAFLNFTIAFTARDNETITYTDIVIPELSEIAEFGTLDPGASPMNGLQQTMDGRYLKFFVRWNGTFRAWRVKPVASIKTFADSEYYVTSTGNDTTDLATHIRMMGAYVWQEYADLSLMEVLGHRFQELNNSMLLTKHECYKEAVNSMKRMQEQAYTQQGEIAAALTLEPEDRVTTSDGSWLISAYNLSLGIGEVAQELALRKYVWGEP